ncbi:hypothetical protein [Rhizohabitans arisaemae]|uniref:hypothetical protein n=1 Tax=Rhizohabitans arisaemae TaxID=2720610 RepID=UPI0024B150BC|nr:hypothetical protein [Rhizohabitans arisaemae]
MEEYRALLAADVEGFTTHPDTALPDVSLYFQRVIRDACEASGLGKSWDALAFRVFKGDGVLAAFPIQALARLIDPFAAHVQHRLSDMRPELRSQGIRLRLRLALHAGLLDDRRPDTPGVSAATNTVSRLLNSQPLYRALEESDPDVTFTAILLSSEVFENTVVGGRTTLRPSQFTKVEATSKRFHQPGYLYVPIPSTGLIQNVSTSADPRGGPGSRPPMWMSNHVKHGNINNGVVQGHQIAWSRDA